MAQGDQACLMGLASLRCPSPLGVRVVQGLQLCQGILGDPAGLESLADLGIPGHPSHQSSLGVLALLGAPLGLGDLGGLLILVGPTPPSLPRARCNRALP